MLSISQLILSPQHILSYSVHISFHPSTPTHLTPPHAPTCILTHITLISFLPYTYYSYTSTHITPTHLTSPLHISLLPTHLTYPLHTYTYHLPLDISTYHSHSPYFTPPLFTHRSVTSTLSKYYLCLGHL